MIKKVYNLMLKIPFMLFIIVLTGFISLEALLLIGEFENAEQLKKEVEYNGANEDKYGKYTKYYILEAKLVDYLDIILTEYKENGIESMPQLYNRIGNEYGYKLFDLVIADEHGVYDSSDSEIYRSDDFEANYLRVIGKTGSRFSEVKFSRQAGIFKRILQKDWQSLSIYQVVDEELCDYFVSKRGNLAIRICAREIGSELFFEDIDEIFSKEKSIIDDGLRVYVSGSVMRLVIYVIIYVLLWILEILKIKKNIRENETCGRLESINSESVTIGFIVATLVTVAGYVSYREPLKHVSDIEIPIVTLVAIIAITLLTSIAYGFLAIIIKKLFRGRFISDMLCVRVTKKLIRIVREAYGIENYGSTKDIKRLFIKKVVMDILVTVLMVIYIISFVIKANRTGVIFTDIFELLLLIFVIIIYAFYIYRSIGEYKYIRTFNKVTKNIDYLYMGMYELVDKNDDSEINTKLANLSIGYKTSLAKQIEAEKLQVELITNVSHDLKTPLTSIISYVDLLSKEELPAVAADYVKILVDKSDRLKTMVSDVFDLAKASSGEEIQMESLDGMILVNQVLSDMGDAIAESGREIKVKADVEVAPITGNGQKLYRVFQNVIGNALKYSMPGTRIFVNTYKEGNEFIFTIKNVSEFEIDFTEEEILSRFVRGDKSRNSEGNGLGLSIAKSFTEQCGGLFEVKLDDDMFMIIIRLK